LSSYLEISRTIGVTIRELLHDRLRNTGFVGETLCDRNNLKSSHVVDDWAGTAILDILASYRCNVAIESTRPDISKHADFSIYVDPIDGSLNWDRGVGDPCVVVAIADKPAARCLDDLTFSYVEGLRSGDIYYTKDHFAFMLSKIIGTERQISCSGPSCLSEATAYLRPGYSMAERQLKYTFPLFLLARDIRAIDNAGLEFCEIARNAADIMIEARNVSDYFNLLAYPILRNAGGLLVDLNGNDLGSQPIEIDKPYDYIACNNRQLLEEALNVMKRTAQARSYEHGSLRLQF
jgi:fructose-1,6-bisphosphatase/inositol monophosphatase family enzyme